MSVEAEQRLIDLARELFDDDAMITRIKVGVYRDDGDWSEFSRERKGSDDHGKD